MKNLVFVLVIAMITLNSANATYCVAHRGNNDEFLENSLAAIKSATTIQSDGIEFDVHITKDRQAIVLHDSNLDRTAISRPNKKCDLETPVAAQLAKDIKENCLLKDNSEIPFLEDILPLVANGKHFVLIEFKAFPTQKSLDLIEHSFQQFPEKLRIISFELKALRKAHKSVFWKKIKKLHLKIWPGLPDESFGVNLFYNFRSLQFLHKIFDRERGVWTVDNKKSIKKGFKSGLEFITTNNPKLCLKVKSELKQ